MRRLGPLLLAACALGAVAVATAQATPPSFYNCVRSNSGGWEPGCLTQNRGGGYERTLLAPDEKVTFSSKIGTTELVGGELAAKCTGGSAAGDTNGPTEVVKIVAKLTGCELVGLGCKIKSPSGAAGEVVSVNLKGKLGAVAEAEAKSKTGLSLEPESSGSTEFATLEGTCIATSHVTFKTTTSRIIGEIAPVNTFGTTGELIFKRSGTAQVIKTFEGASETNDNLEAFGSKVGLEQLTDNLTYAEMLEILW
ncbi:MAG TPA: hypothetical protein VK756_01255 [Solirubrobacteraceae bacterium]|nr:hypothetical protein [Solirubrobacteraceae bacterium]